MTRIVDEPKARTRRKTFHYVLESDLLRHISKYSILQTRKGDKKAWIIEYEIPEEEILGKQIYEFTFTNSGGFIIRKYPAAELLKDFKDRKLYDVSLEELRRLQFEIEDEKTKTLLEEGEKFYYPMINEIKEFKEKMNIKLITSERVSDFFKDWKYGEAACLCNYPEESRQMSLEQTYKLIHQWWTLKIVHEALKATKFERGWFAEQGKPWPASIFVDEKGVYYTCWFEPEIIREAPEGYRGPFTPLFERRVVWKRPDLVISKGRFNNLLEANKFDVLIECKNLSFRRWWKNGAVINEDLIPYNLLFKPKVLIVASLKPIPHWAKRRLENEGFYVVDEFYPGGVGLQEFSKIIIKSLAIGESPSDASSVY